MTPAAFSAALDDLGLSQIEFARLTGLDVSTPSRWVRGLRPVPTWVGPLLDAWRVAGVPDAGSSKDGLAVGVVQAPDYRYPSERNEDGNRPDCADAPSG